MICEDEILATTFTTSQLSSRSRKSSAGSKARPIRATRLAGPDEEDDEEEDEEEEEEEDEEDEEEEDDEETMIEDNELSLHRNQQQPTANIALGYSQTGDRLISPPAANSTSCSPPIVDRKPTQQLVPVSSASTTGAGPQSYQANSGYHEEPARPEDNSTANTPPQHNPLNNFHQQYAHEHQQQQQHQILHQLQLPAATTSDSYKLISSETSVSPIINSTSAPQQTAGDSGSLPPFCTL